MAGNSAAYKQLTPTETGISRDVQFWSQDAANQRREKKLNERYAQEQKDKEVQRKQELYDKYVKPLNNYDTKSQSLNEIQGRLLASATEQYIPLIKTLEDKNASQEARIKATIGLQNLNQLPEKMKLVTDFQTQQWEAYVKGRQDGTVWENPEYEKVFKEGFSSMQLGLDENFDPTVAFVDADGDGVMDVQSYSQMNQGLPTFKFQKKFNEDSIAMGLAEKIGESDTSIQTGYNTVADKGIDENKLTVAVDRLFENSEFVASTLKKAGLTDTPENIAKAKAEFINLTKSFTDKKHAESTDQSARLAAAKLAKDGKTTTTKLSEPVKPTQQTWQGEFKNIDTDKVKAVGVSGVSVSALKGKDGQTFSNATVKNYTYNKNGDMVVEIVYPKTKTITKKDLSDLEEKAAGGDASAQQQLQMAILGVGDGGAKVVIPGQNDKAVVTVAQEDESQIASALNMTIEETRKRALADPNDSLPTPKAKIPGWDD